MSRKRKSKVHWFPVALIAGIAAFVYMITTDTMGPVIGIGVTIAVTLAIWTYLTEV